MPSWPRPTGRSHAKARDFESRLNEIEKSKDVAALGTPEEQRTWVRLRRVEDYLAAHPDDPDLAEMREKERLMKGVVYWRLSGSFKAGCGTHGARSRSSKPNSRKPEARGAGSPSAGRHADQ